MASGVRIVLGNNSLAKYPDGGGHWTWFLQYALGLTALGHDLFVLESLLSSGNEAEDRRRIEIFFNRMDQYQLRERCALLLYPKTLDVQELETAQLYGRSREQILETIRSADLMWNLACSVRQPMLSRFKRRVLIDVDPGHLQISALTWEMDIQDHQALLTVGRKIHDPDCGVPTLGLKWQSFAPFVYLPMWQAAPDPGRDAAFSSVTHWTWEELNYQGRVVSVSKRAAYLRYAELPKRARRSFHLAAYIIAEDKTGDRELLETNGWTVLDPRRTVATPEDYREFIIRSRAEIQCPKPIHPQLRTGWFSDRSACYLASGRPVLAEDTGFGEHLPTGEGLLQFSNIDEAVAGVAAIDADYARHSRAARRIAEEHLDSRRWLPAMLAASGV
jgi:hypothetical protein